MIDPKLFDELKQRTDEGKRFFEEVCQNEEYKAGRERLTIIDLGANVGNASFYFYDIARQIYAIEANFKNYSDLVDYKNRYLLNRITPFHLAIAGENGKRALYESGGCGGFSIYGHDGLDPVEEVEAKTLLTFLNENDIKRVDVLKIDVEGAEKEIFDNFEEASKRIDYIIGENHGHNIKEPLEKLGYKYDQKGQVFTAEKI